MRGPFDVQYVTGNVQRESDTVHSKASSELGWWELYEEFIQVGSSKVSLNTFLFSIGYLFPFLEYLDLK